MKNKTYALLGVGLGLLLAGCAPSSNFVVRDADAAKKVKKVAVLPFQNANARASEDTSYPKYQNQMFTNKFLAFAQPALSGRYEFLGQEQIMAELKKMGFVGFDPDKGGFSQRNVQPSGYTVPQAVEVGKKLGADAVFLGTVAMTGAKPPFGISVRMLDVKTGRVIVAGSAASGGGISFSPWNAPMKRIVQHLAKEAP